MAVTDEAKCRKLHELLVEAHTKHALEVRRSPLSREQVEKWRRRMKEESMYLAPLYIAAYLDLRRRLY